MQIENTGLHLNLDHFPEQQQIKEYQKTAKKILLIVIPLIAMALTAFAIWMNLGLIWGITLVAGSTVVSIGITLYWKKRNITYLKEQISAKEQIPKIETPKVETPKLATPKKSELDLLKEKITPLIAKITEKQKGVDAAIAQKSQEMASMKEEVAKLRKEYDETGQQIAQQMIALNPPKGSAKKISPEALKKGRENVKKLTEQNGERREQQTVKEKTIKVFEKAIAQFTLEKTQLDDLMARLTTAQTYPEDQLEQIKKIISEAESIFPKQEVPTVVEAEKPVAPEKNGWEKFQEKIQNDPIREQLLKSIYDNLGEVFANWFLQFIRNFQFANYNRQILHNGYVFTHTKNKALKAVLTGLLVNDSNWLQAPKGTTVCLKINKKFSILIENGTLKFLGIQLSSSQRLGGATADLKEISFNQETNDLVLVRDKASLVEGLVADGIRKDSNKDFIPSEDTLRFTFKGRSADKPMPSPTFVSA